MVEPTKRDSDVNPAVYGWFGAALIGVAALSVLMTGGPPAGAAVFLFLAGAFLIGMWMWKGL